MTLPSIRAVFHIALVRLEQPYSAFVRHFDKADGR
jgi:hypothetical protein